MRSGCKLTLLPGNHDFDHDFDDTPVNAIVPKKNFFEEEALGKW